MLWRTLTPRRTFLMANRCAYGTRIPRATSSSSVSEALAVRKRGEEGARGRPALPAEAPQPPPDKFDQKGPLRRAIEYVCVAQIAHTRQRRESISPWHHTGAQESRSGRLAARGTGADPPRRRDGNPDEYLHHAGGTLFARTPGVNRAIFQTQIDVDGRVLRSVDWMPHVRRWQGSSTRLAGRAKRRSRRSHRISSISRMA